MKIANLSNHKILIEVTDETKEWISKLAEVVGALDVLKSFMNIKDNTSAEAENISPNNGPVNHGRWMTSSERSDTLICSVCDAGFDMWKHEEKDFHYCPNCGAKMDEVTVSKTTE